MEKKITKEIRKTVAKDMRKTVGAVEVMRVSEAIVTNADAIYAVPGDAVYLAKSILFLARTRRLTMRLRCDSRAIFRLALPCLRNAASASTAISTAQPPLSGSAPMGASRKLRSSIVPILNKGM